MNHSAHAPTVQARRLPAVIQFLSACARLVQRLFKRQFNYIAAKHEDGYIYPPSIRPNGSNQNKGHHLDPCAHGTGRIKLGFGNQLLHLSPLVIGHLVLRRVLFSVLTLAYGFINVVSNFFFGRFWPGYWQWSRLGRWWSGHLSNSPDVPVDAANYSSQEQKSGNRLHVQTPLLLQHAFCTNEGFAIAFRKEYTSSTSKEDGIGVPETRRTSRLSRLFFFGAQHDPFMAGRAGEMETSRRSLVRYANLVRSATIIGVMWQVSNLPGAHHG